MWIFAYGSLIWKLDFPYEMKLIGHVKGFERKFSTNKGAKPGRIVTLVPSQIESQVWGVAYKIKKEDAQKVVDYLDFDFRKKGGYKRMQVMFHPKKPETKPFEITIYIVTADNLNYARDEGNERSIAKEIIESTGLSGSNIDYVCKLAKVMREIAPYVNDKHLFRIQTQVLFLLKAMKKKS